MAVRASQSPRITAELCTSFVLRAWLTESCSLVEGAAVERAHDTLSFLPAFRHLGPDAILTDEQTACEANRIENGDAGMSQFRAGF